MELLAPAGDEKCLRAAVENGANAVYLGGKVFNARSSAGNFSLDELSDALEYAHLRGVKIYVTVNTLIKEDEFPELLKYLEELLKRGVDGVIVQDCGVMKAIRELLPELRLHISTQVTIHNLEAVKYLEELGIKRVVLSRELSLKEIAEINKKTKIELEVFSHGALCVSYSGQCLFSSMIGGRSGNRGKCAQPCRLPYKLVDQDGREVLEEKEMGTYLLSPRDLKTIERLPELKRAGVHSLKIEGRMKKPEYVATVVRIYRQALDRLEKEGEGAYLVKEEENKALAQIFNRDFTSDYLSGQSGLNLMSYRRPNNRGLYVGRIESYSFKDSRAVIRLDDDLNKGDGIEVWVSQGGRVGKTIDRMLVDGHEVKEAHKGMKVTVSLSGKIRNGDRVFKNYDDKLERLAKESFNREGGHHAVDAVVEARVGRPLTIMLTDNYGHVAYARTSFLAEKALKKPLDYDSLEKQLAKMGGTVFFLRGLTANIEDGLMVPVSEINQARRAALDDLAGQILKEKERKVVKIDEGKKQLFLAGDSEKRRDKNLKLSVSVSTIEEAEQVLNDGADRIYLGGELLGTRKLIELDRLRELARNVKLSGKELFLAAPRILKNDEFNYWQKLIAALQPGEIAGIMASNWGTLQMIRKESAFPIMLDTTFNIFNTRSLKFWQEQLGARLYSVALSTELNMGEIKGLTTGKIEKEVVGQGNLILTVMEHCPLNNLLGKGEGKQNKCHHYCKRKFYLQDRKNVNFPLMTNPYCRTYLLNAMTLSILDNLYELKDSGVDLVRIEINGQKKTLKAVPVYRRALDLLANGEDYLNDAVVHDFLNKREGFTKGHFYRGV